MQAPELLSRPLSRLKHLDGCNINDEDAFKASSLVEGTQMVLAQSMQEQAALEPKEARNEPCGSPIADIDYRESSDPSQVADNPGPKIYSELEFESFVNLPSHASPAEPIRSTR